MTTPRLDRLTVSPVRSLSGYSPDEASLVEGVRETFVERREETFPEWASTDRFDGVFGPMVLIAAPADAVGATLRVGDRMTVGEGRPERASSSAPGRRPGSYSSRSPSVPAPRSATV